MAKSIASGMASVTVVLFANSVFSPALGMSAFLQLDFFQPRIFARGLVEVSVDTKVFHKIHPNNAILTDYESSINKFNYMYKNRGDELDTSKESFEEEINNEIKKNKIDLDESNFINTILKNNQKQNYIVSLRTQEEFSSPKNSVLNSF